MLLNYNHIWKYTIVLFGFAHLTSAATLRCYYTFTDYKDVPLNSPGPLVTSGSPYVDINKPTYFIAIGFNFLETGPLLSTLVPTMLSLGEWNVCLVNWVKEAAAGILGDALGYTLNALPNSKLVGKEVGKAIKTLVDLGLLNDIHFVGHSLGAQLAGYAGKEAKERGIILKKIIALDPARLGYDPPSLLYQNVDKSCADFVYCVHCDVNGYAVNISSGHVDFWPNFANYIGPTATRLQPGCSKGTTMQEILSNGNRCSHDRCWQFYNIALTNPSLFEGGKADNYYECVSKAGNFQSTNFIGPLIDQQQPGQFYLVTSAQNPFGLGVDGLKI